MGQITKPFIFSENQYTQAELDSFIRNQQVWRKIDLYKSQLEELFEITYPFKSTVNFDQDKQQFIQDKMGENSNLRGDWVYFPWNGELLHTLTQTDLLQIRTNRNKLLITKDEQELLYNSCVGVVGLSNGNSVAVGLQYQGIAGNLKLADFDILETSNLNRVRAGLSDLYDPKVAITARQIYEINPVCNIVGFENGLTEESLDEFVNSNPKPRVIVEIIDDFLMKVRLRLKAREAGIPVLMFSNLGDSILVDIERYDLDPNLALFNGKVGDMVEKILEQGVTPQEINKYAVEIVGLENVPERALKTLSEINKTLVGRPQLSSTVNISGSLGTYICRKIILGDKKLSGRIRISLDTIFDI